MSINAVDSSLDAWSRQHTAFRRRLGGGLRPIHQNRDVLPWKLGHIPFGMVGDCSSIRRRATLEDHVGAR